MQETWTDSRRAKASQIATQELVVARDDDFDFFSTEYLNLFSSSSATAFQHPLWLDTSYRKLAPTAAPESWL